MKRLILTIATIALCAAAAAQTTTQEEYLARLERLVRTVGPSGVGVETLLDRWEADYPDDQVVHAARFNYYFQKSQRAELVPKGDQRRFLGNPPSLTLKDADGQDVNYFEETFFDEAIFSEGIKVLDRQIALHPDELSFRTLKISALSAYEKESPDMAAAELKALVERQASAKPAWTFNGEPADAELFQQAVGEHCYDFFQAGSPSGYEYFREISERMNKLFPKNPVFLDNLGSYQQVVKKNDKQAAKYYKKALKLNPDDYAATTNLQIIERQKALAKKK